MTAVRSIDDELVEKLEFAQLKMISKRSEERATKVIRTLTDPDTRVFLNVNGYWDKVTGFKSSEVVGQKWEAAIPERYRLSASDKADTIQVEGGFSKYECPLIRKDGREVMVTWYAKYLPTIGKVISIGHIGLKEYALCLKWNLESDA